MKFEAFFKSVNNLVERWKPDDPQAGATPRGAMRQLYDQMREEVVYEFAEKQRKRDERLAATLHKHYLEKERFKR